MNDAKTKWPDPAFQIVLVEPDIPPNTGNIARLCAATGSPLHLVEPLGFRLTNAAMKRAGLDYWSSVDVHRHKNFESFLATSQPSRTWFFSTKGSRTYTDVMYQPGDALIFGSETRGLSEVLLSANSDHVLTIPMLRNHVRSLNLANSVSIVLFESLRQYQKTMPDAESL